MLAFDVTGKDSAAKSDNVFGMPHFVNRILRHDFTSASSSLLSPHSAFALTVWFTCGTLSEWPLLTSEAGELFQSYSHRCRQRFIRHFR